jgi:hypothetical protein
MIVAQYKDRVNYIMNLHFDLGVIGFSTMWNVKKAGLGKMADKLKAIHKANSMSWLGTFTLNEDGTRLFVNSHINLTEQLSERDIVGFLETFEKAFYGIWDESGLRESLG